MKRTVLLVALVSLMALGGQSFAELCTIDNVPAATLLLPYFEVSLQPTADDDVQGIRDVDTFFSVNNASAAPAVAHVTLWGDYSLPSIDFDIFLTGYDIETISMSDVFNNGNLPITAHAGRDFTDEISPHGRRRNDPADASGPNPGNTENPQWDSFQLGFTNPPTNTFPIGCSPEQNDPFAPDYCPDFPGCNTNLPLNGGNNPVLTDSFLDRVRCGHTGRGLSCIERFCIGAIHEDDGANDYIARGYVTIDNVRDCNLLFPSQQGYFGTQGFALNVNQLWGDWFIVQEGRAIGDTLVAIEAYNDVQYPGQQFVVTAPNTDTYTFYGRYVAGLGTDQREPLATTWATRYFKPNPLFDGGTDLFVWRDSKCQTTSSSYQHQIAGFLTPLDPTDDAYDCRPSASAVAPVPPWYPLDETQVVSFDTQEDAFEICGAFQIGGPVSPPGTTTIEDFCFPLETGRYSVSEGDLADIPYDFGWLYLNLNFTLGNTQANPPTCTTDGFFGDIAQSWVISELDSEGIFSVGYAGTQLASACGLPARRNYATGPNGGDNNIVITGDLN